MRIGTVPLYGLFALTLLVSSGCAVQHEPMFNRPDGAGDDPVLIIPFSEPKNYRWYGESDRGQTIATAFETWVMQNATPNFPEGRSVDEAMRIIRDWNKSEIDQSEWVQITRPTGARYVIIGEIEELSLASPEMVGILDAKIVASYRVIDLTTKSTAWRRRSYPLGLGRGKMSDAPIVDPGNVDRLKLEKKLLAKYGELIGRDLYGWEEEHGYNQME